MYSNKDSSRPTVADILARLNDYPAFCDPLTDVNQVGTFGDRPLNLACYHGNVEEIRVLIEAGADVNALGEKGATPLHDAARGGHVEAVKLLLSYGAKPNVTDEFGSAPVNRAELGGYPDVIDILKLQSRGKQ
jgi:ankyrin repeat protein